MEENNIGDNQEETTIDDSILLRIEQIWWDRELKQKLEHMESHVQKLLDAFGAYKNFLKNKLDDSKDFENQFYSQYPEFHESIEIIDLRNDDKEKNKDKDNK